MKTQKTKSATKKTKKVIRKDSRQLVVVTLKRMPAKDALPAQAFAICECLKKGPLTVAELKQEMVKRIKSVQSMARLWVHYRPVLLKRGAIAVAKQ